MDLQFLAELSDSDLLARVKRLAHAECRATAALIAHLIEVENRKLYLGEACSSLFTYCVRVLHCSEPAAYNRIFAARAARTFPAVLSSLERGEVHLAAVRLLAPLLTAENHRELLAAAAYKTKREIEELVAEIRPQADVRQSVRKLPAAARPEPVRAAAAASSLFESAQPGLQVQTTELNSDRTGGVSPAQSPLQQSTEPSSPQPHTPSQPKRAAVVPLAPERYKVQFTASAVTRDKLRRAQELLRHRIPDGDVSQVIDLALELLVQGLEKKKFGARAPGTAAPAAAAAAVTAATTTTTTTAAAAVTAATTATGAAAVTAARTATAPATAMTAVASGSRCIPAEVRQAVWHRDQGRCAFTGQSGERCGERSGLEFDHIRPHADGGGADVSNIRLLCHQHNQYEARQFFGTWRSEDEPVPRCG